MIYDLEKKIEVQTKLIVIIKLLKIRIVNHSVTT